MRAGLLVGAIRIDRIDVHGPERDQQIVPLVGRQVDGEHAVDAGLRGSAGKGRVAHHLDRVEVAHQHDRRRRVPLPELAHHVEDVVQAGVVQQRTLAGALDHRAVGHRIRERDPEFDRVGAGGHQGVHQRHGDRAVRVAGGDERDQRLAPRGAQLLETGRRGGSYPDPLLGGHGVHVLVAAAGRLIRMIWSRRRVGASFAA